MLRILILLRIRIRMLRIHMLRILMFGISGALHINNENVAEDWLDDDQVSAFNVGGNGPVTRNEVRFHIFNLPNR